MKKQIIKRLQELRAEYEAELKNGSKEYATSRARELQGEIRGIQWVLNLFDE